MNDKNGYFILSTTRVLGVRTTYNSTITSNPLLSEMFVDLETMHASAISFTLKLDTSTKKFTTAGEAIRDKAALDYSIAATALSSYGVRHKDTELESLDRYTQTELRHGSLQKQVINTNYIKTLIQANTANLPNIGIDAEFLAILNDDLSKLETDTLAPQNIKDKHKNDNILFEELLKGIRSLFDKQIDRLMQIYRLKNIELYLAYTAARKVRHHHLKRKLTNIDTETSTGILELLVLDKETLEPLAGVQLLVLLLNLVSTTDEEGETYDDEIAPGTYQGKLTYDGYKDLDFTITIEAGKTCTLQLLMEKIA